MGPPRHTGHALHDEIHRLEEADAGDFDIGDLSRSINTGPHGAPLAIMSQEANKSEGTLYSNIDLITSTMVGECDTDWLTSACDFNFQELYEEFLSGILRNSRFHLFERALTATGMFLSP
jgi:hypothetical protein